MTRADHEATARELQDAAALIEREGSEISTGQRRVADRAKATAQLGAIVNDSGCDEELAQDTLGLRWPSCPAPNGPVLWRHGHGTTTIRLRPKQEVIDALHRAAKDELPTSLTARWRS